MKGFERGFLTKPAVTALLKTWPEPKPDPETDPSIAARNEAIVLPVIAEWLQDPRR